MYRIPFHLVQHSPWPVSAATSALILTLGLVTWFHMHTPNLLIAGILLLLLSTFQWWRDISREATHLGNHTSLVMKGLRWGMLLFIISEMMFFFAFFWAFFHSSLAPTTELGCMWPPMYITTMNPYSIPLLNTAILLASGVSVTWCHHSMISSNIKNSKISLFLTIILGLYFSALQINEYMSAPFTIADSVFGSNFFIMTGFHGLHVLIGTSFLLVCMNRLFLQHFSNTHHLGFEMAAWYWHFVDVVWICLFLCLYSWGM